MRSVRVEEVVVVVVAAEVEEEAGVLVVAVEEGFQVVAKEVLQVAHLDQTQSTQMAVVVQPPLMDLAAAPSPQYPPVLCSEVVHKVAEIAVRYTALGETSRFANTLT